MALGAIRCSEGNNQAIGTLQSSSHFGGCGSWSQVLSAYGCRSEDSVCRAVPATGSVLIAFKFMERNICCV